MKFKHVRMVLVLVAALAVASVFLWSAWARDRAVPANVQAATPQPFTAKPDAPPAASVSTRESLDPVEPALSGEFSGEAVADRRDPRVELPARAPTDEERWAREIAGLTAAELERAVTVLETEVQNRESDAASERHDRGQYEVVPSDQISSYAQRSNEITVFQLGTGGELHRVDLSSAEYPELHALKDKLVWLKAQAALAAAKSEK